MNIELGNLTRLSKKQLINIFTLLVKYCDYETIDKNILCNLEYYSKKELQQLINAAVTIVNNRTHATAKTIPTGFGPY